MCISRLVFGLLAMGAASVFAESPGTDRQYLRWESLPDLPDELGVAGPIVGVHNDALIVAGGANFPKPHWESKKAWHDQVWVLVRQPGDSSSPAHSVNSRVETETYSGSGPEVADRGESDRYKWLEGFRLNRPVAYGACASTSEGVVCMGGTDGAQTFSSCFLLVWDPETRHLDRQPLPALPRPCAYGSAACIGEVVYLAGGQSDLGLESAMASFWRLDLSKRKERDGRFGWEILPAWPGPSRAFHLTVAQHNGFDDCIYVFSGRRSNEPDQVRDVPGSPATEDIFVLRDMYEFNPMHYDAASFDAAKGEYAGSGRFAHPWRPRGPLPRAVMAGTGIGIGQSHIFVLSGADGSLMARADELRERHPGFPRRTFAYHTITNTWIDAGPSPANPVTTPAVRWGDWTILASGEVKPRVRTRAVWAIEAVSKKRPFGSINSSVLAIYLLAMVAVGAYFARRNKDTEDFFRGGQKVLWWAAGCSIFATMLSSITYMAIPAKAFAQDWVYLVGNLTILAAAPVAVYLALPFFRRIDATSAYEYLERRFNAPVRWIASALFTVFHVFRMGIVMSLAALALSTIADFGGLLGWVGLADLPNANAVACVLIMGLLSVIYSTLGGVTAVIWTDTVQTVVLLGGALLCFFLMFFGSDGGATQFVATATADAKLHLANFHFDATSASLAFWVVVLGAIGQNVSSYSADQAVVQRYMTTPDAKRAASSIWTAAILAMPASLLFFALGTGLYTFYKANPDRLDPTYMTDQIFPLFIAEEVPVGIAGLIVAGVFAAAQSTISTSMNSTATAVVTDFLRPLNVVRSERGYLRWARGLTLLFGVVGTALGLLFVDPEKKSLFDEFLAIVGLFMGVLGGLFLLGILTRRAHGVGGFAGAVCGTLATLWLKWFTSVNGYIFATVGITVCFVVGYLVSVLIPMNARSHGLTIHTLADPVPVEP